MAAPVSRAIVFGNSAQLLPERTEEGNTHTWTVYLRAAGSEVSGARCEPRQPRACAVCVCACV